MNPRQPPTSGQGVSSSSPLEAGHALLITCQPTRNNDELHEFGLLMQKE
jgi:hypothetical protein